MSHNQINRRKRASQNNDKQMLRKLYSQYNITQSEQSSHSKPNNLDPVIKDTTFVSSNNQNYTKDEINRAYMYLCNNSDEGIVNVKSLVGFLEEQGENFYTGVEMIALLDKEKKGYVSMEEFFGFFDRGVSGLEAEVPEPMKRDQLLVRTIDKHYDKLLKNFADYQYCEYAAKQIKRFKYSQQL